MNIAQKMPVILFKPFSALFWDAKMCEAPPIPPMPSPFGECIKINKIKNTAQPVAIYHNVFAIYFLSPFLMK